VPVAAERLRRILAGYRVVTVVTFAEAKQALSREKFKLAVLGVYFEESRMFELLSFAKGSLMNRDTPIVCVLGMRGALSGATIRSLEQAVNSLPGSVFLNLIAIPDDERGNALVRRYFERLLRAAGASGAASAGAVESPPAPATRVPPGSAAP
jgi:DNA-binding NtrC family response regulator